MCLPVFCHLKNRCKHKKGLYPNNSFITSSHINLQLIQTLTQRITFLLGICSVFYKNYITLTLIQNAMF